MKYTMYMILIGATLGLLFVTVCAYTMVTPKQVLEVIRK